MVAGKLIPGWVFTALGQANSRILANAGQTFRINLLFTALFLLANYAAALAARELTLQRSWQGFLLAVFVLPVYTWLTAGLVGYYRRMHGGAGLSALWLFRPPGGFLAWLRLLFYNTGVYLLYMISIDILREFSEYDLIIQIRLVLGVLLFLVLVGRSIYSIPLILEGRSLIDSVRASYHITRDEPLAFLFFFSLLICIGLGGIVLAGVGFLYTLGIGIYAAYDVYSRNRDRLQSGDHLRPE
jgi:hypothetical protein